MKQTIEMCAVRLDRMGIKRFTATTPLKEGWAGTSDIYHWWVALIPTSLECESMHMLWRWSNHLCNFLKHDPRAFGQGQRTWMVRLTMWNVLTKHVQWKDERTEENRARISKMIQLVEPWKGWHWVRFGWWQMWDDNDRVKRFPMSFSHDCAFLKLRYLKCGLSIRYIL